MKKRAEEIFQAEAKKLIYASSRQEAITSITQLIALASIMDSMGAEADADRVDSFIKEAASFWDFLFGGASGALTSKDEKGNWFGEKLMDAFKDGNWDKILNKEVLLPVVTKAVMAGATSYMAGAIVDKIGEEFPSLGFLKNSMILRTAISSAMTYAVTKSDFASHLTDGIIEQIKKIFGWGAKQEQAPAQPAQTKPQQPVAQPQPKPNEGTDARTFQVAAPGAKA